MDATRYNWVTFKFAGADADQFNADKEISLKLESDWTINGGLDPDINQGIVSFKEFRKLIGEDGSITRQGKIRFYFTSPTVPDVIIPDITLILAEPTRYCTALVDDPSEPSTPPEAQQIVAEYRLWFADFRHAFQPRAGDG